MRYMVIEWFRPGCIDAVYRRFAEKGRMLPPGLAYLDSWLARDHKRCFQLMETGDPGLLEQWTRHWEDLVDFEIVALGERPGEASRDEYA